MFIEFIHRHLGVCSYKDLPRFAKSDPKFWNLIVSLGIGVMLSFTGCSAITAVNIPGVGYIDFDPAPVTSIDKTLMSVALANAANQQFVDARSTWIKNYSGNQGEYIVTGVKPYPIPMRPGFAPCGSGLPGAELTEVIYAGGREFRTSGMGVYLDPCGKWNRYQ